MIEKFASYGFNKSHSAAYALIAYQTGYLKSNYPAEFMASNLTSEVSNADKIILFFIINLRYSIYAPPPTQTADPQPQKPQKNNIN